MLDQYINTDIIKNRIIDNIYAISLCAIIMWVWLYLSYKEEKRIKKDKKKENIAENIKSTKSWISFHEDNIREGQPWFGEMPADEWLSEERRYIENLKDTLLKLEDEQRSLIQGQ